MHDCPHDLTPAFGYRCCYSCLKERLRRGEQLDTAELDFVGFYEPQLSPGDGWHQADRLPAPGVFELSPEDSAMLSALMDTDVPRGDQLDFLA